jgi:hypothetical protein
MYRSQGRKEVAEGILIAAGACLVNSLINWGIETIKERKKTTPRKDSSIQADQSDEDILKKEREWTLYKNFSKAYKESIARKDKEIFDSIKEEPEKDQQELDL